MATEAQEHRRPWQTPQITFLFTEQAEGGTIVNLDEAGHIVTGVPSLTVGFPGLLS